MEGMPRKTFVLTMKPGVPTSSRAVISVFMIYTSIRPRAARLRDVCLMRSNPRGCGKWKGCILHSEYCAGDDLGATSVLSAPVSRHAHARLSDSGSGRRTVRRVG